MAAGDLNGDGLDDLIIGSPMWTNYEIMGKYETGRVYVVYQDSQVQLKHFGSQMWNLSRVNLVCSTSLRNLTRWMGKTIRPDLDCLWLVPVI